MEKWKTIPNVTSVLGITYDVSNRGRVRSSKGKPMKRLIDEDGYFFVSLRKGDSNILPRVNRLVAQAFIPNPDNLPVADHKDRDKQNDHEDNLQWLTVKQNTVRDCARPVARLDPETMEILEVLESSAEAARKYNLSSANINQVAREGGYSKKTSKIRTSGGFSWKYMDL